MNARPLAVGLLALSLLVPRSRPGTGPGPPPVPSCAAPDARVRIDHVVVAVASLDAATTSLRALGFTVKEGALHRNGLRNRHVKFEDGSYLELMAVEAPPLDSVAGAYASFLDEGEGGAFLALRADPAAVMAAAAELGLGTRVDRGRAFDIVTVADDAFTPVFFLRYGRPVSDPPAILAHGNGATGIAEVRIEGGKELAPLLTALGARPCDRAPAGDGPDPLTLGVGGGRIAIVPGTGGRPRVLAVRLRRDGSRGAGTPLPSAPVHGIRLDYESPAP